jgi:hypothetical protein
MNATNTDGQKKLSVTQIRNILKKEFSIFINLNVYHEYEYNSYIVLLLGKYYYVRYIGDDSAILHNIKRNTLTEVAWYIFNEKKYIVTLRV